MPDRFYAQPESYAVHIRNRIKPGFIEYRLNGATVGLVRLGEAGPVDFDTVRINPSDKWIVGQ